MKLERTMAWGGILIMLATVGCGRDRAAPASASRAPAPGAPSSPPAPPSSAPAAQPSARPDATAAPAPAPPSNVLAPPGAITSLDLRQHGVAAAIDETAPFVVRGVLRDHQEVTIQLDAGFGDDVYFTLAFGGAEAVACDPTSPIARWKRFTGDQGIAARIDERPHEHGYLLRVETDRETTMRGRPQREGRHVGLGYCDERTALRCGANDLTPEQAVIAERICRAVAPRPPPPPRTIEADLDGDGTDERVELDPRSIAIAGRSVPNPLPDYQAEARVIDLDRKAPGRELLVEVGGDDHDATFYVIRYLAGRLTVAELAGHGSPRITGDGYLRWNDDNCGQTSVHAWKLGAPDDKVKVTTRGRYRAEECAACPFVYRRQGDGRELRGEILRDLRAASLETVQELAVGRVRGGVVEVDLAEHKPETTYVDELYLRVGALRFAPRECLGPRAAEPECQADGRYRTLVRGETRAYHFELPPSLEGLPATLVAEGYYLPD